MQRRGPHPVAPSPNHGTPMMLYTTTGDVSEHALAGAPFHGHPSPPSARQRHNAAPPVPVHLAADPLGRGGDDAVGGITPGLHHMRVAGGSDGNGGASQLSPQPMRPHAAYSGMSTPLVEPTTYGVAHPGHGSAPPLPQHGVHAVHVVHMPSQVQGAHVAPAHLDAHPALMGHLPHGHHSHHVYHHAGASYGSGGEHRFRHGADQLSSSDGSPTTAPVDIGAGGRHTRSASDGTHRRRGSSSGSDRDSGHSRSVSHDIRSGSSGGSGTDGGNSGRPRSRAEAPHHTRYRDAAVSHAGGVKNRDNVSALSTSAPVLDAVAPRSYRSVSGGSAGDRGRWRSSSAGTNSLYKTELCRSWGANRTCKYGSKCQFAHGKAELRPVVRHPKYKTQLCKTYSTQGHCPYGARCRFIHRLPDSGAPVTLTSSRASLQPRQRMRASAGAALDTLSLDVEQRLEHRIPVSTATPPAVELRVSDDTVANRHSGDWPMGTLSPTLSANRDWRYERSHSAPSSRKASSERPPPPTDAVHPHQQLQHHHHHHHQHHQHHHSQRYHHHHHHHQQQQQQPQPQLQQLQQLQQQQRQQQQPPPQQPSQQHQGHHVYQSHHAQHNRHSLPPPQRDVSLRAHANAMYGSASPPPSPTVAVHPFGGEKDVEVEEKTARSISAPPRSCSRGEADPVSVPGPVNVHSEDQTLPKHISPGNAAKGSSDSLARIASDSFAGDTVSITAGSQSPLSSLSGEESGLLSSGDSGEEPSTRGSRLPFFRNITTQGSSDAAS